MQYESKFHYLLKRIFRMICPLINLKRPSNNLLIEKDIVVKMRDNVELSVNIYRPNDGKKYPVILSLHPYGKDKLPSQTLFGPNPLLQQRLLRQTGITHISTLTSWESPDPDFGVSNGYVVINADARGYGKSSGEKTILSDLEAQDYYELIEWAAAQSWCNGKVGLNGVSYLAISQYKVAALNPPHLYAICPWEGFSDLYRDAARPGGIREDGFIPMWSKNTATTLSSETYKRTLIDEWYKSFLPDLEKIKVPALVCGSFSDHYLHSQGSFRVFNKISSKYKWLYTHRDGKWFAYYSKEALSFQLKFFDYFLKGANNDLLSIPLSDLKHERHVIRLQQYLIILLGLYQKSHGKKYF
jgi:predicted acyl esterase